MDVSKKATLIKKQHALAVNRCLKISLLSSPRYKLSQKNLVIITFLYVIVLLAPTCFGSSTTTHDRIKYLLSNSSVTQKLTQKSILSVVQTKSGLLWLATFNGIHKYDGHHLVQFVDWVDSSGTTHQLNAIELVESPNGTILAAARDSGLLIFDETLNRFSTHPRYIAHHLSKQKASISSLLVDSSGTIWIGHEDGSVSIIRQGNNEELLLNSVGSARISDIVESPSGQIHIASEDGRFASYEKKKAAYSKVKTHKTCSFKNIPVEEIFTENDSVFLIGTRGSGLYSADTNNETCSKYPLISQSSSDSSRSTIHSIDYVASKGEYRIATDQGLYIVYNRSTQLHFYMENSELTNDEVTSIFSLAEGPSWIGTYNGVNVLTEPLFDLYDIKDNSKMHSITAIGGSKEIGLWVATYNGLFSFSETNNTHVEFRDLYPDLELETDRLMTLLVEENSIWLGSRNRGLLNVDLSTRSTTNYSATTFPKLSANSISALLRLSSGELLVGTYGGGLNIIRQNNSISSYLTTADSMSIANDRVILLFQDSAGRVWVGTEGGLQIFDLESETFLSASFRNAQHQNLEKSIILCATEDNDGNIWFGTLRNGLLFSPASKKRNVSTAQITPYGFNEFADTPIYAIQSDREGGVWLATNSGLAWVRELEEIRYFRKTHGLQSMEFEYGASYKDTSGRIYFGGSNGYNRFNPSNIVVNTNPPPLVLTDVTIAGSSATLSKPIKYLQSLELDYLDYYITFEFSILDYLDTANNQYRYKLEGFDPDWIDVGNRNTATYTNLPAGSYQFLVQGASSAGVWNRDGISTSLKVNPAPWNSWWAYCLYAVSAILIAWHAKKTYDNAVIRRRAIQLAQEMQETADRAMDDVQEQLDHQSRLVESIHRFNLDKLTLVNECFARHAEHLPSSVNATYAANQERRLVALACLEKSLFYKHDTLLADLHKFTDILAGELVSARDLQGNSRITVINDVCDELFSAEFALPLSIVLYELFSNAVDHAFDPGSHSCFIRIEVKRKGDPSDDSDFLFLSVSDNGLGLPEGVDFQSPRSAGIATVAETVAVLGGAISVNVRQGTEVQVRLPSAGLPSP
ncbi:two-component regulator propeller domain-containing protein [Parahaliea mediterranea]|uniref:Histidine kinase/HSP90-like ATPase domain-containing protein n=1 Tax=Parahaliea mediterranea TaxID=651086 RepID=A0A939DBQ1_9GAMM|nr:two-component regulator propeller domain-containing protein [Parahaliea mediterranea]MBN7795124.1 hypothetical protein [Parahaliea mediterranea]